MMKVRYKSDINQFLLEFKNWNVMSKVAGIMFRKLITDQIPEEVLRHMSMYREYVDDREWLQGLRQGVCYNQDFQK